MIAQDLADSLLCRVAALEKQNHRMKIVLTLLLSVAVLGSIVGFAAPEIPEKIIAKDFELVDAAGNTRVRLFVNDRGPLLGFWDSSNKHRVSLALRDDKPFFVFSDGGNKTRLAAGCGDANTWLRLYDAKQQLIWEAPTANPN